MPNLYWKSSGQTRTVAEKPFKSEAELESFIFDNQDILGGDIFVIYRQIRTGAKQGIPDMLGVDQDKQVCLTELKNKEADESILPQALGYAVWAESNPDSVKAIWLESKTKPEDIQIDWDHLDIRVILIAPSFNTGVRRMASKIGYPVDLIQVRRYSFDQDEFLLVETIEEPQTPVPGTTKPRQIWDWATYEAQHGKEATAHFRHAVEQVSGLVDKHGWDLHYNINKYYTGFKLGNKVAFSVAWATMTSWELYFKVPEEAVSSFSAKQWELRKYYPNYRAAYVRPLDPASPHFDELEPLFAKAVAYASGAK